MIIKQYIQGPVLPIDVLLINSSIQRVWRITCLQNLFEQSKFTCNLTKNETAKLKESLKYVNVLARSDKDLVYISIVQYNIDTYDAQTPKDPRRRIPHHLQTRWIRQDIEKFDNPWASRVLWGRKKDWSLGVCIDYGRLDAITIKYEYHLVLPYLDWMIY